MTIRPVWIFPELEMGLKVLIKNSKTASIPLEKQSVAGAAFRRLSGEHPVGADAQPGVHAGDPVVAAAQFPVGEQNADAGLAEQVPGVTNRPDPGDVS